MNRLMVTKRKIYTPYKYNKFIYLLRICFIYIYIIIGLYFRLYIDLLVSGYFFTSNFISSINWISVKTPFSKIILNAEISLLPILHDYFSMREFIYDLFNSAVSSCTGTHLWSVLHNVSTTLQYTRSYSKTTLSRNDLTRFGSAGLDGKVAPPSHLSARSKNISHSIFKQ
jgi:hypothetical protein